MVAAMLNSTFQGVSELLPFKSNLKVRLKVCIYCLESLYLLSGLLRFKY